MPLSEEEQRILQELEKSIYESDPKFAKTVDSIRPPHVVHARKAKIAGLSLIVFLVMLVVTFTIVPFVGFICFVGMATSALVAVHNITKMVSTRPKKNKDSSTPL